MHRWTSNDKSPADGRWTFARRMFIHWGPEKDNHSAHLDVYLNRRHGHGWGFMVRFDGPHAETPIDAGLFLGRLAFVFAGTSLGRTLNRLLRVTGETAENRWQGGSRELAFRISNSTEGVGRIAENLLIEWHLWSDPDHSVFGKWDRKRMLEHHSRVYTALYATIRRGYHHPIKAILDAALGKTVYTSTKEASVDALACFPEGIYPLRVTLERATWKRPRSWRTWMTHTSAEASTIPVSDGGTGYCPTGRIKYGDDDGLVSCSTRNLTPYEAADPGKWTAAAVARFTESVLESRARNRPAGWTPEHPLDKTVAV